MAHYINFLGYKPFYQSILLGMKSFWIYKYNQFERVYSLQLIFIDIVWNYST